MDFKSIPEIFQSRVRLSILSTLITNEKTFMQIRELTLAPDGSLNMHLKKLEESGCITSRKDLSNKKPRSTYYMTEYGLNAFREYVAMLEDILGESHK